MSFYANTGLCFSISHGYACIFLESWLLKSIGFTTLEHLRVTGGSFVLKFSSFYRCHIYLLCFILLHVILKWSLKWWPFVIIRFSIFYVFKIFFILSESVYCITYICTTLAVPDIYFTFTELKRIITVLSSTIDVESLLYTFWIP